MSACQENYFCGGRMRTCGIYFIRRKILHDEATKPGGKVARDIRFLRKPTRPARSLEKVSKISSRIRDRETSRKRNIREAPVPLRCLFSWNRYGLLALRYTSAIFSERSRRKSTTISWKAELVGRDDKNPLA